MTRADNPPPRGSAEAKLVALIARPDGWQRHFHKRMRRILSGAVPGARGGSFLMPSERTRADRPVMDAELTDRAPFPQPLSGPAGRCLCLTDPWRIISSRMILLKHKGIVYGRLDRDQFVASESLLRLDAGQEPARSLWVLGQFSSQFFAKHGYTVLQAQAQRHYTPPAA